MALSSQTIKPTKPLVSAMDNNFYSGSGDSSYSVSKGATDALKQLLLLSGTFLPECVFHHTQNVVFKPSSKGDGVYFPTPLKEQEATAAIKGLEGCMVAALADLRFGSNRRRLINVDLDKVACFLMSAYLTTIDGMDKTNPLSKAKIPGWYSRLN